MAVFGIQVQKTPRSINGSGVFTYSCNAQDLKDHLFRAGFQLRGSGEDRVDHRRPPQCWHGSFTHKGGSAEEGCRVVRIFSSS